MQQHVAGARRRWRRHRADDRIGRQRRLQHVRLEPAVEDRPRRTAEQFQCGRKIVAESPQGAMEAQHAVQVAPAFEQAASTQPGRQGQQFRRNVFEHRFQRLGDPRQPGLVTRVSERVARREACDLPPVQLGVRAHQQAASVGQRRERRRHPRQHPVAVPRQFKLALDVRQQQRDQVRGGGSPIARRDLLADGSTADDAAPFEHQHAAAGARQVGGTDQAVVAGADNDRVVARAWPAHRAAPAARHELRHWRHTDSIAQDFIIVLRLAGPILAMRGGFANPSESAATMIRSPAVRCGSAHRPAVCTQSRTRVMADLSAAAR